MLRSSSSWLSRNSSISLTNAVRRLSSNHGILAAGVGRQQPHVAHLQPLAEEILHQRRARARIGEHAPHLLVEAPSYRAASLESPDRAAHRPECCSRGRTTGATPARRPRCDTAAPGFTSGGIGFDAEQEIGADEQPLERRTNAGFEVAVGASGFVEARAASARLRCVAGRRYARRARFDRIFVAHAVSSVGDVGVADEDAAAAQRLLRRLAVVRPADEQHRKDERRADVAVIVVSPDRNAIGSESFRFRRVGLDAVTVTSWRPAFRGTRTSSLSSAVNRGFPASA